MNHTITKNDILPLDEYMKVRAEKRREILDIKKSRRVALGPDVMVHFENFHTLCWQIQEMLYIEKGGEEQLHDELAAYAPLVPNGQELVTTVMIEIEDPTRRREILSQLGHFENSLRIRFGDHVIKGVPEQDVDRTNEEGKTSSVHFIHWPFTAEQIMDFRSPQRDVILESTHPNYTHKVVLGEQTRLSVATDFRGD